jgi:hypothetical protein
MTYPKIEKKTNKPTPWPLVRERTIPIERPPTYPNNPFQKQQSHVMCCYVTLRYVTLRYDLEVSSGITVGKKNCARVEPVAVTIGCNIT